MRIQALSLKRIKRCVILFILYIVSGSTYITLDGNLQKLPIIGILLICPVIIKRFSTQVSGSVFLRGLYAYVYPIFIIVIGMLHGDGLNSYFRIAATFLFAYLITVEFSFDQFKNVYIKFVTAISFVGLVVYFYLQAIGQISFSQQIPNGNGVIYRIGWIYNYIERLPQRNMSIFWEPGLYATILILAVILELVFTEKPSVLRLILFHVCIITTYSSAGYVLIILCDLILLNKWIVRIQKVKYTNYIVFVAVYIAVIFVVLNLDSILIMTGLAEQYVYGKLTSDNLSNSMRFLAINNNLEMFRQSPFLGLGITQAYEGATGFADTSTTTFMLAEIGVFGILPTLVLIISVFKLGEDIVTTISLLVILISVLNKEPHMGVAILWVFMFYFLTYREKKTDLNSHSDEECVRQC